MSKQIQVNTFTEGLNKDLNPIITPNNVLTDCLNGTIITYNGNEFALQNDLGNYGFKYSGLSNGYIPVGMKEHANILYIISYNPLLNRVEIGSFPSQKTISEANINDADSSFDIILDHSNINLYTKIKSDLTIVSTEPDLLLAPGDMYILQLSESDSSNKTYEDFEAIYNQTLWKHVSPYIFTESHRLYNIDGLVELYTGDIQYPTLEDFKYVKWDVPGWLALKSMINVMSEFNAYLVNPKYNYSSGSILSTSSEVKLQSVFNKNVYNTTVLDSIKENLRYIVFLDDYPSQYDSDELKNKLIELNGSSIISDSSAFVKQLTNKSISYNSIDEVIYSNFDTRNEGNKFYVHIIPTLRIDDDGEIVYVLYDQFYTVLSLHEREFNANDISIGKGEFNYRVDNNSLTLNIDINAFPNCKMYKRLRRIPEKTFDTETSSNNNLVDIYSDIWDEEYDYNYSGQNIIDIPFTTRSAYISNKYSTSNKGSNYYNISVNGNGQIDKNTNIAVPSNSTYAMNSFDKEDIYELTIRIYYPGVSISSGSSGNYVESKFTIYASDIINNFASIYDNFNNIDDSGSQLNAYTIFNDLDRVVKTSVFDYTNFMYNNKIEYYSKVDNKEQVINNINDLITADYDDPIFQDYFAKLYSNNEYDYTSKHLYIGGKSEYKINKDLNSIISLPLNQYEVVGRMWRSCKYLDGLSISLNDSNNNTFNINIDEDGEATFNIASEYDIYADTIDSFNKQAAINSISMMDVNDSPVTFQDNNFYIKKSLIWHKSASSPGRTRLGPAEAITSNNIRVKFNVVGSEYELSFFYTNVEGESETFVINTGRLNQDQASFTRMFKAYSNLWREIDEPRENGNSDAAYAITQKAYAPYIFININLNSRDKRYQIFKDGTEKTGGYDITNFYSDPEATSNKGLVSIVFPGLTGDIPAVLFSSLEDENNKNRGILNALAFYSLMCKYVRYAVKVSPMSFYFPNYRVLSPKNTQVNITNINYNISRFEYEYSTINNVIPVEFTETINLIKNGVEDVSLESSHSLNVSLSNKAFIEAPNVITYLNNIVLAVNQDVDAENKKISNYKDINEGDIYLDWEYDNIGSLNNSLNIILDFIKYDKGRFYFDARTENAFNLRISDNHYRTAAYVPNFYYNQNEG